MSETEKGGEEGPEGVVFRYNRARRLERAPESARWLASRYGTKAPGFFGVMFATRASRLLFLTIIALAIVFNLMPAFRKTGSAGRLGEDRYSAKAFWFDDRVFVSLSRTGRVLAEADRRAVSVVATSDGGSRAAAGFIVGLAAAEDFRLALDQAGPKPKSIALDVSDGAARLKLQVPVE